MRITKLVVGILMIVYSVWLFVQALTMGLLGINKSVPGGVLGILISLLFLAAGIVYICTESADGLGGDIACLVMLIVAGVLGFVAGTYNGLLLDGILALIIGFGFFIWHAIENRA